MPTTRASQIGEERGSKKKAKWRRAPQLRDFEAASGRLRFWAHRLTALCRHGFDPEIVHLFAGPKLLSYPAWLLAATGPRFRRFVWIPEFRQNRWVRSATLRRFDCGLDVRLREQPQSLFKHF